MLTDEQVFLKAIELPAAERENFVAEMCGDDSEFHHRVASLLAAHQQTDSLLDTDAMNSDSGEPDAIPQRLGDFDILRELGRGGMGVVYEARQRSLKRKVALKVLSSGLGLSSKAILRFRREAEAAGKLHHTNIVPIYTTGDDRGVHYYAMELVDGPSLDRVIRDLKHQANPNAHSADGDSADSLPAWVRETALYAGRAEKQSTEDHDCRPVCPKPACPANDQPHAAEIDPRSEKTPREANDPANKSTARPQPASQQAENLSQEHKPSSSSTISSGSGYFGTVARMMADVADALDHAHEQGVIHRDVKPSNLLLSPDGRLSINDFGLARMLEQPGMTISGEFVGSPLYMSPEQITAGRAPLDHRTDIYSLGATLYEMLTLQPPFPGDSRDQVITQIMYKESVAPRRLNRRVPLDLETICLKALEKDPDRRYQTAGQLASDLRCYVNRYSISARRVGPVARIAKWVKRNQSVSALLFLLLIITGIAVGFWYKGKLTDNEFIEELRDNTLLAALGGEFPQARLQLERAKRSGAHRDWVSLMEGQIKMLEGDYVGARLALENALRDPHQTTAATAMLTISYGLSGQEDEYMRRFAELNKMPATTYQDHLLKGWAGAVWYPDLAKLEFAEARRMGGPKPMLLTLESIALTRNALYESDINQAIEDAEKAIRNTQAVRTQMEQDNSLVIAWQVMANCVAARLYRETRDSEKAKNCLDGIPGDLELLAQLPRRPHSDWAKFTYYSVTDQEDQLLDAFDALQRKSETTDNYTLTWYASLCFARKDFERAKLALELFDGPYRETARYAPSFVQLAEIKNEEQRSAFRDEFIRRVQRCGSAAGTYLSFDWCVFRLLGSDDTKASKEAKDVAARFAEQSKKLINFEHWPERAAFMLHGNEEQLMHASRGSQMALELAHFHIAIDKLSRGDRQGAKAEFAKAVALRPQETIPYWWSKAFLKRLEEDDNFLWWLKDTARAP